MGGYVLRRLWQTIPVLFGVSLLAFAVMHVVPGDPVRLIAGPDEPESVVERIRFELGLDRPLHEQYWSFLSRALRGDLGRSLRSRAPARPTGIAPTSSDTRSIRFQGSPWAIPRTSSLSEARSHSGSFEPSTWATSPGIRNSI